MYNSEHSFGEAVGKVLIQLVTGESIEPGETYSNGSQMMVMMGKVCTRYKVLGKIIKQLVNR